ncbi:unnamed protein product [Echinostoma caproni]|uniref:Uncharacterized protein n=1 Tax=Echinostoma caproni TaxID=27848 RepID=A0A183A9P2_9TREM|nr:unnamed protein product [Echinostoma caproni]
MCIFRKPTEDRNVSQRDIDSANGLKRNVDARPTPIPIAFDVGSSDTTVSFTLDTSYDLPGEDDESAVTVSAAIEDNVQMHDRLHDQISHPTATWNDAKQFTHNRSIVERYRRDLR